MGIDIEAKLIYGLPYADLPEEILDEVNEMLDNGEIDYASPTYDSPRDEWIVGVEVSCEGASSSEMGFLISETIAEYPDVLKDVQLKFYVSAHVT